MTTNPTDRRDRIADVLAAADGWQWVTDRDKARSSTYRSYQSRADAVLAVLSSAAPTPPTDQTAVLLWAADRVDQADLPDDYVDLFDNGARWATAELRRVAAEAQQQECSPACDEQHTYRPGCALAGAQQQETTAHGCTIDGQPAMPILVAEYNQLVTRAAEAGARQQPDTETHPEETGAALARHIADQPMSTIQGALRILGWPLRFELVEDGPAAEQPAADTQEQP